MCVCACVRVCVCMCVCTREKASEVQRVKDVKCESDRQLTECDSERQVGVKVVLIYSV